MKKYEKMTKAELIRRINALEKDTPLAVIAFERERLLHELQAHQMELETQNRELREAQSLIEVSRDRFADLYDFAPVGCVTLDDEGIIREVNLTAAGMLGVERDRLAGAPFHLHVAREDLAIFREHLGKLTTPDAPVATELLLVRKGRDAMPVLMQSVPAHDAEGKGNLRRTTLTDLTARRRAEEALRCSEEMLRSIIDHTGDIIAVKDCEGRYLFTNPAGCRAGGFSPEDVIGRTDIEFQADREQALRFMADDRRIMESRQPEMIEEQFTARGGEQCILLTNKIPRLDAQGRAIGIIVVCRDITERIRAGEQVRQSEQRLRAIYDGTHEYIGLLMPDGTLLEANRAALAFAGSKRDDVVGFPFWETVWFQFSPGAPEAIRHAVTRAAAGEFVRFEAPIVTPSGAVMTFDISFEPIRDESGEVILIVPEGRDITERKQAEMESRASTQRVSDILTSITDGFHVIDARWCFTEFNFAARQMFAAQGVDAGALIGKHIIEEVFPDARNLPSIRALSRTMTERVPTAVENFYEPWQRWFSVRHFPTPDGGAATFFQDITERKQSEEALRESDERFRQVVENIDEVFWMTDVEKNEMLFISVGYEKIWGRSRESLLASPRTWLEAIDPEDRDRVLQAALVKQARGDYDEEYRIIRPDGGMRWIRDRAFPIRNADGTVTRIAGIAEDITERKWAGEALRESERFVRAALNGLTAGIALLDEYGTILAVNDAWRRFAGENGLSHDEACAGVNYLRICDEARGPFATGAADVAAAIRHVLQGGHFSEEIEYECHSPSEQRWFAARVTPFAGDGPRRVVIAHENITQRKRAEAALQSRSRQQQAVAELGQHALAGRDLDRLIQDAVALVPQVLGVEFCKVLELLPESGELLLRAGTGWKTGCVGRTTISGRESQAGFALRANEAVIVTGFQTESRFPIPSLLKEHGIASGVSVIIYGRGRPFGFIGAHSREARGYSGDDVNFVQSVANVLAAAIERRDIEEELLKTSDEERARIGQDLHDDLCQQLTGIEFRTAALKEQLAGVPAAQEEAARIGGFIRDALLNARMLARGLSPVQLEAGGLMSALQEFVTNMTGLFRVPCEFRCESPVPVADPFVATHLYRIAQEAITNAVRHGGAKNIVVSLASALGRAVLTIADDGIGCATPIWKSTGMGLRIMQYRSEMIGATLRIQPGAGGGTVVTCEFQPT